MLIPSNSQSGFSAIGCEAVSNVAVSKASGCFCNKVIGYSAVSSENSATRKAVCFHEPVSLYNLIFFAERHSFIPRVMDIGGTN